jgi:aminopeptidase N
MLNRFRRTPAMLEFFSKHFGPYRFCKYGTVVVFPFLYGAMENQTITNIGRGIFSSSSGETTIAHEVAHH